jgi:hypothetical protein
MTARTYSVKGTGEKGSGMAICAATAVTAAISAVRVIIATFKCIFLFRVEVCPAPSVGANPPFKHTLTGISGASSMPALFREVG